MLQDDLYLLKRLGEHLDFRPHRPASLTQEPNAHDLVVPLTVRDWLITHSLKIRDREGNIRLLALNRAQQEYSRRCTLRNIVLKARQLGITTYIAARFFIETITQPGSLTVQVAHDQESAEQIFRIVHRFWENLPIAAQGTLVTSRANVRQIVFPRLDSEYRVATAADENAGRGLTIQHLHCSEVARWPGGGLEALTSLRAAVPPHGEMVLESTPRGAGGVFYEEWQRAAETGYTRHFFPWWLEDSYKAVIDKAADDIGILTADEQNLSDLHGLTPSQILFRRRIGSSLRGLAIQEYAEDPESCFLASGNCVFDVETIGRVLETCSEPPTHDNAHLSIWFPPQPGRNYIIGVDPAGGGSEGDYSCAEVIDRQKGMHCAELHGHFPPLEFAHRLVDLGRKYNDALLAVERNNHGYGVLAHLRRDEYPNIFQDHNKDGWLTNAVSRPAMIEDLAAALVSNPELFQSRRLLEEMRTFVRDEDGNTGASGGAHDDCVMAMAIALAVRRTLPTKAAQNNIT